MLIYPFTKFCEISITFLYLFKYYVSCCSFCDQQYILIYKVKFLLLFLEAKLLGKEYICHNNTLRFSSVCLGPGMVIRKSRNHQTSHTSKTPFIPSFHCCARDFPSRRVFLYPGLLLTQASVIALISVFAICWFSSFFPKISLASAFKKFQLVALPYWVLVFYSRFEEKLCGGSKANSVYQLLCF